MSEHYFTASPATGAAERTHVLTIRGREHEVTTASGVFSSDRLDKGTQVLLDHVPQPPAEGTFLDLGCGWGPVALALADASPGASVLAVDINERALDLTARNAAAAGHARVRVAEAGALARELRQTGRRLDLIWSNPPVRVGKEALHELLLTWLPLLGDTGEAWLVVGRNLGADSLARWLAQQGWTVDKQASSKGFRVLRVSR
ncbi:MULTISPECIES: methyltransferase [unclassified Actinomyces]|uniref:class I SAM-dependent methyltransferase n=1 Tax=unclassified Actinomyces TaxID=2609248 RepID=UPI002017E576|nr:methyltransferase [Actinomyces sp. 217892]MCL3776685.1 methyltransferase [Actinomyces sp. AC-20-1]MCL3789796.1 methyltransferase [Actinomyces sp. 187325]MCL3793054.1 methyltransferase [Actinomyces sp. 186855]